MKDLKIHTLAVDLWSIGVLAYELHFGFTPFKKEISQWVKLGVNSHYKWKWNQISFPK